jgi:hypothetical protein
VGWTERAARQEKLIRLDNATATVSHQSGKIGFFRGPKLLTMPYVHVERGEGPG